MGLGRSDEDPGHTGLPAWRPILTGKARRAARDAIDSIAVSLRAVRRQKAAGKLDLSLASGEAGVVLLHCWLAHAGNATAAPAARLSAERLAVAARADRFEGLSSLYGGAAGRGWVLSVAGRLLGTEISFDHTTLLHSIVREIQRPREREYDLISGIVGTAVYALERLPDPAAMQCLETIVAELTRMAESSGRGKRWRTPARRSNRLYTERLGRRRYATGVAHGVTGIAAVLASIHAAGIARRETSALAEGAVGWLLERYAPTSGHCFPDEIDSRGRAAESFHLGWCWGDVGIAAVLLRIAKAFDRDDWKRQALEVATMAATVHPRDAGVLDGGLCHGTAGIGHLFNRMYQDSGDAELLDAARFWLRQTLRIRRPGRGIGGFFAVRPTRFRNGRGTSWRSVRWRGFLGGSAGIALALSAAIGRVEPSWDAVLLCEGSRRDRDV